MKELGNAEKQEVGRWANNRVENSHLSFRRRERAMLRFRRMKTLQKFASVHANVHNHFNLDAISSPARPTRNAAQPHWLSGVRSLARLVLFKERYPACGERFALD
jgi:putative transposase